MSDDYQNAVLTDTPVVYYRLDQLGFGVDGEVVPDLSGNGLDATLAFTGNAPAWGHSSPIDTDSASREFWGYTNAGIFGFSGESHISCPSDPLMEPSPKDFTVEQWLRPMAPLPGAIDLGTVAKSGTGGVLLTAAVGGEQRIGGFCFDSAGTFFRVTDSSFEFDNFLGQSFHVVVVRSGDALALYVNGSLRGITTVTSGLPTQFTSGTFNVHPDTLFYSNARHDEAAYYNYALSGSRILAHYEAALNELTMRGESNIRTTAIINGADDPDPVAYPFRHNWSSPVVERFRWRSSVFKPVDGPTGLARQRSAPRRQVEYSHLLYSERLRQQFEARSFAARTAIVQFEPDKVQLPTLSTGATTATFDTRYKDFEIGDHVLFYVDDETYEYATLLAVTDEGIEWDEPLTRDYTRVWVKPARVARLPLEQSFDLVTDAYGDSSTIYEYQPEDEPLNPRRITPFTPTLTYRDRDAFDLAAWQGHNYTETPTITFTSDRTELDDGTGVVTTKQYRWGAEMTQPYNMLLQGREVIARYLGWLYARAGQSNPFWMPTFRNDLTVVGVAGDELTVRGHDYSDLYASADTRLHLAFVYRDNTTTMREIVSVAPEGSNDVLTLDSSAPTLTNLRYLSFLRRVILSSDDLEVAWETDNVARVAFAVIDAPVDLELGSPSTSPSPSASLSTSVSPSASTSFSLSPSSSASPSASTSPSPSGSISASGSPSLSPSSSGSPSSSTSMSVSPSSSGSASISLSPSPSSSQSSSSSASVSPSASPSPSV